MYPGFPECVKTDVYMPGTFVSGRQGQCFVFSKLKQDRAALSPKRAVEVALLLRRRALTIVGVLRCTEYRGAPPFGGRRVPYHSTAAAVWAKKFTVEYSVGTYRVKKDIRKQCV